MKAHLLIASLIAPFISLAAAAAEAPKACPLVDCDCEAISDSHWRSVCESREAKVVEDCLANQGRPKSFCGLHGPAGFPVATSIQPDKKAVMIENEDIAITSKLIATQNWSLDDSVSVLKSREKSKQYGDAVQVAGLLERDIERLYQLQRQADATYKKLGQDEERLQITAQFASSLQQRAQSLQDYSATLWQQAAQDGVEREQKAYRALAFKVARLAGATFEYAADMHDLAGAPSSSAKAWQAAAEIAQSLEKWERSTENKEQHVAFYQAQAAARWHRATFELLEIGQSEAVAAAVQNARSVDQYADTEIADNASHTDHEMVDDGRAIKRGSR